MKLDFTDNSILIIANGESILKYKYGNIIDKFSNIVRINNFKTKKYEDYVGSKTTIWFNGANQGLVKRDSFPKKIIVSIPSVILSKKENIQSHISKRIKTKNFKHISLSEIKKYENEVGYSRLTTGMYAILWSMHNYKNVYIHGYDFFINSKGHYYDGRIVKFFKNNNILKRGFKHNNNLEKLFILNLLKSKRIMQAKDLLI